MAYFEVARPGPHQRSFPGLLTAWLGKSNVFVQGNAHWEMQRAQNGLWWPRSTSATPRMQHTLPGLYGLTMRSYRRDVPHCLPVTWPHLHSAKGLGECPVVLEILPEPSTESRWSSLLQPCDWNLLPCPAGGPSRCLVWCQRLTGLSVRQLL